MKRKTPEIQHFRLSADVVRTLDEISDELGDCTRRVAVEMVVRALRLTKETTGSSYSTLLIGDRAYQPELYDRRRKAGAM